MLYLSDNTQDQVDYLEATYPFLHRFVAGFFSHDADVRKPDPRIYELLLEKAAHPATACI